MDRFLVFWRILLLVVCHALCVQCTRAGAAENLVRNGDFQQGTDEQGLPRHWAVSGRRQIIQSLRLDTGREGGASAVLTCSRFEGGTPDSHAMVCQLGTVSVKRGQWYRLTFWAKGNGLSRTMCSVAVSNTRPWGSSGIAGQFVAKPSWQRVELLCQADRDVPAETSRLQFWFGSTGTLWLDDIALEPVEITEQLRPAIARGSGVNLVPNSSFECGAAGWGGYSSSITTWAGNLNRLYGTIDRTTAQHGRCSLRIDLDKQSAPVFLWDYYDAAVQPVLAIMAANFGWMPVQAGKSYVLSCYMKADQTNVPVQLAVHQGSGALRRGEFKAGPQWQRHKLVFRPTSSSVWVGAGIDLTHAAVDSASLWIDAVQLEEGTQPGVFETRASTESFLETDQPGNIFTDVDAGICVKICLWNGAEQRHQVQGHIVVTDFFDREVARWKVEKAVSGRGSVTENIRNLMAGHRGFFRVAWYPADDDPPYRQSLRCALIDSYAHADSPFGMNHAYPWNFMLDLCRTGGLTWMRDWSAKWHTVEPREGTWDFTKVDPQIHRLSAAGLNPLLLLPFPSTPWCSSADMQVIDRYAEGNTYRRQRSVVACPANDAGLFRRYVARTVKRYRDQTAWVEIMNEPLYTTYAVPAKFGYALDDYLDILKNAYEATKAESPETRVIGGIATFVNNHWVQDFIEAGGLRWCDAMNIHLYPVTIDPEVYEADLRATCETMRARGQAKPIWLTEFGCYADDDPYKIPARIGDSAMSRAYWPSERDASEALVKTAAVFLTHGVEKIFFHAGTCGPINGRNGGGIFFEYGGAPRKMYAALNALANVLGPHPEPLAVPARSDFYRVYTFHCLKKYVAIVWATDAPAGAVKLPAGVTARDIMGSDLDPGSVPISPTPVYLIAAEESRLATAIQSLNASGR